MTNYDGDRFGGAAAKLLPTLVGEPLVSHEDFAPEGVCHTHRSREWMVGTVAEHWVVLGGLPQRG